MTKWDEVSSSAQRAYTAINDFFQRHPDDVVEIGVLPSFMTPPTGQLILEDGNAIGIPKKVLTGAFVQAAHILFEGERKASSQTKGISELDKSRLDATRIMLVHDPEHSTAANFRKRNILSAQKRANAEQNSVTGSLLVGAFKDAVRQEFLLLNSILTSPLHRQTKSPTLWNHRRWLFHICLQNGDSFGISFIESFLIATTVRSELSIVMRAGELHPLNYYAWQYARHLTRLIEEYQDDLMGFAKPKFVETCIPMVLDWGVNHPGDTSGFSFLLWLLGHAEVKKNLVDQCVRKVLLEAKAFNRTQESIIEFLQTAAYQDQLVPSALKEEIKEHIKTLTVRDGLSGRGIEQ